MDDRRKVSAATEMFVAADLLAKGYEVFFPLAPQSSCDLVAIKDGKCRRIEVKTGWLSGGQLTWGMAPHQSVLHDVLVVYRKDTKELVYDWDHSLVRSGELHFLPRIRGKIVECRVCGREIKVKGLSSHMRTHRNVLNGVVGPSLRPAQIA